MQSRIRRQILNVKPGLPDDELEELTRDPDAAQKLMTEQVLGKAHSRIKNAVSDIQEKYEAILKLEKSVNELFDLFQELATLVEAQGQMLDNIEANLAETENYLEKAETNLTNAEKTHAENRTKMCYIIICLLIVGVFLVLWLGGALPF